MRLTRFRVQGYKNFTAPVELTDLGPLVVLHGPNNVGKSNLIEAIGLAFALLRLPNPSPDTPADLGVEHSLLAAYPLTDIFTLGRHQPPPILIELDAVIDGRVRTLKLTITPKGSTATWTLDLGRDRAHSDPPSVSATPGDLPHLHAAFSNVHTRFKDLARPGQREAPRFRLIDVHREAHPARATRTPRHPREIADQQVLMDLYDAQDSDDLARRDAWTTFEAGLSKFYDVLGSASFRANYVRAEDRAGLLVEHPDRLIPLRLLGTGIQQVVTLLGTLATAGAEIAAIEEPEGNLSFDLQVRLRRALREMAEDARAPHQIFVTSHAPGIELADHFFNMQPGPDGPVVTRVPMSQAPQATGLDVALAERPVGSAPLSYVTAEGLVRVPDDVREALGLQHGGGVVWLDAEDGFRMVTNAQAMKEAGLDDKP